METTAKETVLDRVVLDPQTTLVTLRLQEYLMYMKLANFPSLLQLQRAISVHPRSTLLQPASRNDEGRMGPEAIVFLGGRFFHHVLNQQGRPCRLFQR